MAAIFEFDKTMPNGFIHRFLLLQDDEGNFTDIARGGPQASEVGSEGLPSGGVPSGAGFGNLTTDVVPYHGNMVGPARNDYFPPEQLAELPNRLVTFGTAQEMRQIFDGYAQTGVQINAAESRRLF
jgi:hypothetical protein